MLSDLPKRSWLFEMIAAVFLAMVIIWTIGDPPKKTPPKIPRIIESWRKTLDRQTALVFTDPVTPWIAGLLLGDDSGFSREWKDIFRATGTSHLTAVSGYNVSVVFKLVDMTAQRLAISRKKRLALGISAIILFVLITGLPASVLRAAVMAVAIMLAREAGRPIKPLRALLLAVVLLVAIKPTLLLYDLGFQLSVLATFGLTSMTEPLRETVFARLPKTLGTWFAETTAATVTVAPVIAYRFGTFSAVALLANVAVIMFIPVLMSLGAALIFVSFIFLPLAQVIARLTYTLFTFPLLILKLFSFFPYASLAGTGAAFTTAFTTAALAAVLWRWWKKDGGSSFL